MCGIVGAASERDIVSILIKGLKRLEYRGYDSAGIAVINGNNFIDRVRIPGKVIKLECAVKEKNLIANLGIAHTRWATHGKPTQTNAHPHICRNSVAVVHNGIIENYKDLRKSQTAKGYEFTSQTDTEVIVHQIYQHHIEEKKDLLKAVQDSVKELEGAYALGVISSHEKGRMIAARRGSPLVIGIGNDEYFIASDVVALLPVTQRFIFLQEGDLADIRHDSLMIYDEKGKQVERPVRETKLTTNAVERGAYRHYMQKEIHEQTRALADAIEGRISGDRILEAAFGPDAARIFDEVKGVHIIACGTSYHSGLVARHWLETLANVPCAVEIASEFRYRKPVVRRNSLIVTISQSGETADTLAGLQEARRLGFGHSLTICNVPESSLTRESDLSLMTHAGPEIGVASTKAFTTQLACLLLLVIALGRRNGMSEDTEKRLVRQLRSLPGKIKTVLEMEPAIQHIAEDFADKRNALFLGRGLHYPIAMEGALKLKEISYIHAEAYAAGELKHGPLALVDAEMPVIVVAPNNELLDKLRSNMQEVSARGGVLYVFADEALRFDADETTKVLNIVSCEDETSPIIHTIPLQLLSYHVAVLKGTDVDQPRNLAKSVTVE